MPFPRHPRFRRAENFPPMEFTARDAEILRIVNRYRFLRSQHITDLVGGSRQQTLRRLQKLYQHGYLERPICQLDYFQRAGSRSISYGLASRGASYLLRTDNTSFSRLDWTSRNRAIKRLFLDHALMVSDIMVSFELACRKSTDVRLLIGDDIPLPTSAYSNRDPFRWKVTVSGNKILGVVPDFVFALEFLDTNQKILYYLEADRGTMPIHRTTLDTSCFEKKLIAYEASWKTRIHQNRFGCDRVRVLAVTTSVSRIENMQEAATKLSGATGLFLFADINSIHLAADASAIGWRNVAGDSVTFEWNLQFGDDFSHNK